MQDGRQVGVVKVESMSHGSIHQRGTRCWKLFSKTEHRRFRCASAANYGRCDNSDGRFVHSCDGYAEGVNNAPPSGGTHLRIEFRTKLAGSKLSKLLCWTFSHR